MGRKLKFNIFRHNPLDPDSKPHMDVFMVDELDNMTLFIALNQIRDTMDPSLQFDFCCRAGVCGSCAMTINGKPDLACHTKTKDMPDEITLLPLPFFKLIGDLSVDTGDWFRKMYERVQSWIHTDKKFDPTATEERMENKIADEIYELDRCIECGSCIAACGTVQMRPEFIGPASLNRVARFVVDPRDQRTNKDYFEIIGTDDGMFGCMGLLACEDMCPKDIPFQDQLGKLRRRLALSILPWQK